MPAKAGKERPLLERFISVYECDSWRHAHLDWLDERIDGAVELLASRGDGSSLAIEHTVIQPHPREKEDFARFRLAFGSADADTTLWVSGKYIYVDIPLGVLERGGDWGQLAGDVLAFIRDQKDRFPDDRSTQECVLSDGRSIALRVNVVVDSGKECRTLIRRYGDFDLAASVSQALVAKLPKLSRTLASKRILMLERDQWQLSNEAIAAEVKLQRPRFPLLADVHEIWLAETHENGDIVLFVQATGQTPNMAEYCFAGRALQWRRDGS